MKKLALQIFFSVCISIIVAGCVPEKKYADVQSQLQQALNERDDYKKKADDLQLQLQSMQNYVDELQKKNKQLIDDTVAQSHKYQQMQGLYSDLEELYNKVIDQNKQLLNNSTIDKEHLTKELNDQMDAINQKQKQLDALSDELKLKQLNIDSPQKNLADREQKVQELQHYISMKDSLVNDIKKKISDALKGFSGTDLTVEEKNGMVYVSMSEKLLFSSGSTIVDDKGKTALKQLADVLNKNPDIQIMVEGHTDNVPLSGNGFMKDNWDLSVLRATSIVRILTKDDSVDPKRLKAIGRGEFFPVADNTTTEGKAKNRRTEIILSPNLQEIYDILNTK